MVNDMALLVGLDGLGVERVDLDGDGCPVVHLVTEDTRAARCPSCQTVSTSPKQRVSTRPRDLPHGGRGISLVWCKRRWRCRNQDCGRRSFTEQVSSVPARAWLTTRLRAACGAAVGDWGATLVQAARDHGVSWPVAMAAFTTHAARALPDQPEPVPVLGIDETRRGRPRWRPDPDTGKWQMIADRWHVGFVDITGGQGLLGQVEGRTSTAVTDWLNQRAPAWRQQVRYVAIDMCSIFVCAFRQALPNATIVVDHSAPRGALSYPQHSWEELEGRFLGLMAHLDLKGEGKRSMPEKHRSCSGA